MRSNSLRALENQRHFPWLRFADGLAETIASLDEACQIDAADLLANRLCQEIADPHMTPNLLDLLIRA